MKPRPTTSPIERMLARKVVDADGCWVWPGSTNKVPVKFGGGNYGQIRAEQRGPLLMVHRVSYEHFHGPIPEGMQVEHTCHTADETCEGNGCKHRLCWNPDHLTLLSHRDNSIAGRAPNMQTHRTGICQRSHDFEQTGVYTWVRPSGTIRRACAQCNRESQQRRRAARKAG